MSAPDTPVLVVDDDVDARRAMEAWLSRAGIPVRSVGSGEQALELLDGSEALVIVADVHMAGMTGYELCRQLRRRGRDEIPFVFCSALGGLPERVRGLRLGADDYLVKPVDPDEFVLRVQAQIERRRSLRRWQSRDADEMSGRLEDITLPDLLQLLVRGHRARRVRLASDSGEVGEIQLDGDRVVHARLGAATGMKALARLVGWESARFSVGESATEERSLDGELDALMLEALSQLDETRLLRPRVESHGHSLSVRHTRELFDSRLRQETLDVLRLVEQHHAVEAILDHCPLPDLIVLQTLLELIESGFVGPAADAEPSAPPAVAAPGAPPADWFDLLADLRREYLAGSAERLANLDTALARVADAPADPEALHVLMRGFHGLAGTGTTYGYAGVSRAAAAAEKRCREVRESGVPASSADLAAWREAVEAVRREFGAGAADAEPGSRAGRPAGAAVSPGVALADVVVIADHSGLRQDLVMALQAEGFSVRSAADLASGVAAARRSLPAAVVLQVAAAEALGGLRELRELPRSDHMVVFLLEPGSRLDRAAALSHGADAVLPASHPAGSLAARLRRRVSIRSRSGGRILSVEDDEQQAKLLRGMLEGAGYEVRSVADPSRFEQIVRDFEPELVLMDVVLPGVDGFALARLFRQDEANAGIPLLFVTTQGQVRARVEAQLAGADDFLVKPVVPWLLLSTVASRLERSRFARERLRRDGVTWLLNHGAFQQQIEWARGSRDSSAEVLVLLDLDGFGALNREHGWVVGDRALQALAAVLRRRLREPIPVGRLGGGRFGAVVPDLSIREAETWVADLARELSATPLRLPTGAERSLTFSAGLAEHADLDAQAWRAGAERALDEARRAGIGQARVARRPATAPQVASAAPPSGPILVVEDDPMTARVLRNRLRGLDHEVVHAGDGEAALRLARDIDPAVIVLDLNLPRRSGNEVLRSLRREPRTRQVPVLVLTTRGQADSEEQVREEGADDFLAKPADPDVLVERLRRLIGSRR